MDSKPLSKPETAEIFQIILTAISGLLYTIQYMNFLM